MATQSTGEDSPEDDNVMTSANDRPVERFDSSILKYLPRQLSRQANRQSLQTAFIHSAAILFVVVCGACALLVYRVLEPFLRSILWSVLAGAFLFPFKSRLTLQCRSYLRQLEKDSHILVYGLLVLFPLRMIDRTIESIGQFCISHWKALTLMLLFLPSIDLLHTGVVYRWITNISDEVFIKFIFIVHLFDSPWITTLVVVHVFAVIFFYDQSPIVTFLLNILAIPVWLILLVYLSQFLPANYRLAVVCLTILLTAIGLVVDIRERFDSNGVQSDANSRRPSIFINIISLYRAVKDFQMSTSTMSPSTSASSTPYFTFVFWSLLAIKIYQFFWYLIPIPFIFISYKIMKYLLIHTYRYVREQARVQHCIEQVTIFLQLRRDVLTPSPLVNLFRFLIKGDKKLNYGLQISIDYLVTAFMIVTLLVSVLFGSILLIIQIRHESIHMIKITSNLVNETIAHQSALQHMLPDREHLSDLMDKAVNNFYVVGRTWIGKQISGLSEDTLSNQRIEEEVLQLWDRLYTYMTNTSTLFLSDRNQTTVTYSSSNGTLVIPNIIAQLQTNFDFRLHDFYQLIHDNLGLLRTVFDSIWSNATLLLTLLSTIISLLFTGGFALFNFLVSFIVFVTLLFYLLSHPSQLTYRPTEWLNNSLAVGGKGLGKAVNDAVTSVFVASLKMAAFYGLYTYVLHTVVGSNLVFLPAVIASICAVTLKSYWAALPGCLDVWLVQNRPLGALLLLLGQITPVYVVDTAIYSEVKGGGHQYLTALAIAGGVYYRGTEGALIGPIVLCCLLVGIRLYNENMARTLSESQESSALPRRRSFQRTQSLEPIRHRVPD